MRLGVVGRLQAQQRELVGTQPRQEVARAQLSQTQARLDELRIAKGNTNVTSPVNGFVSQRNMDVGAWASQQAPVEGLRLRQRRLRMPNATRSSGHCATPVG